MLSLWKTRPDNVKILVADIENLSFENSEKFDIIFSSYALHWLNNFEKSLKILQELWRKMVIWLFVFQCLAVYGN